jgi:ADP-ribosylglycohydrolase
VHYGLSAIPQKWLQSLARHDEVESLFNRFAEMICPRT